MLPNLTWGCKLLGVTIKNTCRIDSVLMMLCMGFKAYRCRPSSKKLECLMDMIDQGKDSIVQLDFIMNIMMMGNDPPRNVFGRIDEVLESMFKVRKC